MIANILMIVLLQMLIHPGDGMDWLGYQSYTTKRPKAPETLLPIRQPDVQESFGYQSTTILENGQQDSQFILNFLSFGNSYSFKTPSAATTTEALSTISPDSTSDDSITVTTAARSYTIITTSAPTPTSISTSARTQKTISKSVPTQTTISTLYHFTSTISTSTLTPTTISTSTPSISAPTPTYVSTSAVLSYQPYSPTISTSAQTATITPTGPETYNPSDMFGYKSFNKYSTGVVSMPKPLVTEKPSPLTSKGPDVDYKYDAEALMSTRFVEKISSTLNVVPVTETYNPSDMFGYTSFNKFSLPAKGDVSMPKPLLTEKPSTSQGPDVDYKYDAEALMSTMFFAKMSSRSSYEKEPLREEVVQPSYSATSAKDNSPVPYCHTEEKVEYEDKCEEYVEETCHTLTREKCHPETVQTCKAAVKERVEEVCVNVTDKVCSLMESENKETVEDVFIQQTCSVVMERVCDTSQELVVSELEHVQCVDLLTSFCTEEIVTVNDTTCTETVEFNCKQGQVIYGEVICNKTPSSSCINTPIQMKTSSCKPTTTTLCDTLTSSQATPIITENCHEQPTFVCMMEEVVRPVVRRTYNYVVSCNNVERKVCKLMEKKKLEAICHTKSRPVCDHQLGEVQCKEENKQFCYKYANVVEVEVCDDLFQTYEL